MFVPYQNKSLSFNFKTPTLQEQQEAFCLFLLDWSLLVAVLMEIQMNFQQVDSTPWMVVEKVSILQIECFQTFGKYLVSDFFLTSNPVQMMFSKVLGMQDDLVLYERYHLLGHLIPSPDEKDHSSGLVLLTIRAYTDLPLFFVLLRVSQKFRCYRFPILTCMIPGLFSHFYFQKYDI